MQLNGISMQTLMKRVCARASSMDVVDGLKDELRLFCGLTTAFGIKNCKLVFGSWRQRLARVWAFDHFQVQNQPNWFFMHVLPTWVHTRSP